MPNKALLTAIARAINRPEKSKSKKRPRAAAIRDQERASAIFKAMDRAGLDAGETSGIPLKIIIRNALQSEREGRKKKVKGK
jgi:ribosomal protein S4E